MKMNLLILTLSALLLTSNSEAAYSVNAKSKVIKLMELTNADKYLSRDFLTNQVVQQIKTMAPKDSKAEVAKDISKTMVKNISEKISDQDFIDYKNDVYDLYLKTYTEEELDAMISFYKTSIGQSVVKKNEILTSSISSRVANLLSKALTQNIEKKSDQDSHH